MVYGFNNPLKFNDPTGLSGGCEECVDLNEVVVYATRLPRVAPDYGSLMRDLGRSSSPIYRNISVRFGEGKNMAQFGTDMLIGGYNRWYMDKMRAAGVETSVVNFFNRFNGNLRNTIGTGIKGQSASVRVWNYPFEAFEEIIANALYHRDYQTREPVEIRIYPDKVMVINYGGPDRSIKISESRKGAVFPRRYRNRRLGDFLKELDLTEGKATGIPTIRKAMKANGSPLPDFITDEERSFFQVNVLVHPWFLEEVEKEEIPPQIPDTIPDIIPDTINLPDKQKEIAELLKRKPKISLRKISVELDIHVSTVREHINALKEKGVLERIGGTRGYWKVLSNTY